MFKVSKLFNLLLKSFIFYADGEEGGGGAATIPPEVQAQIDAAVTAAIGGLKSKNSELLGAQKGLKESLAKFDGIDADSVRTILANFASTEEAALIAAGKVDQVLENRTARMKAGFEKDALTDRTAREAADARAEKFSNRVLENGIRSEATAAGLHQFAIEDALYRAKTTFALDDEGNPAAVEGAFGKDGKPLTLKEWFVGMKETAPHWFPATGSGGGAQQSAKFNSGADLSKLSPTERLTAARAAGKK